MKQFIRQYQNWTVQPITGELWSTLDFPINQTCNNTIICTCYKCSPKGKRCDDRYKIPTVKHIIGQKIWGAMSVSSTTALYFLLPKFTMNGSRYLNWLSGFS